jgi:SAM-dependent methyltransferase
MAESYDLTAEFYDIVSTQRWGELRPRLRAALNLLTNPSPTLLDVGAGTGRPCVEVCRMLPAAKVIAVEPDRAMRSILLSRVWDLDGIRDRITVCPNEILDALGNGNIPTMLDGCLILGVLGHFDPTRRSQLWSGLRKHLRPGGLAIVEPQPPNSPRSVDLTQFYQGVIGELSYEGWREGVQLDESSLEWRLTYRVYREKNKVYESKAAYVLHPVDERMIAADAQEHGFQRLTSSSNLMLFAKSRE